MADKKLPETTDRLRRDIDSGQAGDKADWPDPAAAPLGTDDEASGNPPNAAQVRQASPDRSVTTPLRSSGGAALTYVAMAIGLLIVFAALIIWALS